MVAVAMIMFHVLMHRAAEHRNTDRYQCILDRHSPFTDLTNGSDDPRDLSRVFVPSPTNSEYLTIPYADLRRPPITLAELDRSRTLLSAKQTGCPCNDRGPRVTIKPKPAMTRFSASTATLLL
jgi:hypothetical protein